MEFKYKFDVTDFHKLLRLLETCRPMLAKTFIEVHKINEQVVKNTSEDKEKQLESQEKLKVLNEFLEGAFSVLISSENLTYELLASSTNKTVDDIKQLSIPDYIRCLKGLIAFIPWDEIMGELKNLIPEKYLELLKKESERLKKQTLNNSN